MKTDWTPLRAELKAWRSDGLTLPIWWRDDDAVSATPELSELVALSQSVGVPVHLAVIPMFAQSNLVQAIREQGQSLIPLVHGWAHENHAPDGQKKAEFGLADHASLTRAKDGLDRLRNLFGANLVPCFVPPWNRIDPKLAPDLSDIGYSVLSTYGPRSSRFAADGLEHINTHIDPINWRGDRSAVASDQLIATIVTTLKDRREGRTDASEPLGLLTHHLVHDQAIWDISKAILSELLDGPVSLFTMTPKDLT